MLARRIIPCLDVDRGRVVKGVKFVDLVDAGDPVEAAGRYDEEGADELVFLDIGASHEGREIQKRMVERVAERLTIPFTVGGDGKQCRRPNPGQRPCSQTSGEPSPARAALALAALPQQLLELMVAASWHHRRETIPCRRDDAALR